MTTITLKELLQAGVHFGHQTQRWNPKMKRYIFGARNGIHIIDLQQTVALARKAGDFVKSVVAEGKQVLFVGTKKQAKEPIQEDAVRVGMPYVTERWLGGLLTNFETVTASINRMKQLEEWKTNGTFESFVKKEQAQLTKELNRLQANLGGIRDMKGRPGAIFVVDPHLENIAVKEANKLNIPVVAVVDTNCDPDEVKFHVPGNDDALRSIKLFTRYLSDCCAEGKNEHDMRARASAEDAPQRETRGGRGSKAERAGV